MKTIATLTALATIGCAAAQAENITNLDTGAGLYSVNNGGVLVDPNWTVSLLSTDPAGQTPPGGLPTGAAYLVPTSSAFPFGGFWLPNSVTSSWLTYSSPIQLGADNTDGTYQYQLTFTAANSGVLGINFLSDNTDKLYINGDYLGANPGQFSTWLATPLDYTVVAGTAYTMDLDVVNGPRDDSRDPTGGRIEFSGNINVGSVSGPGSAPASVPEQSSALVNVALLALPLGAGLLRKLRPLRIA